MEAVTGIDVSWMTYDSPKDKSTRSRTSIQPTSPRDWNLQSPNGTTIDPMTTATSAANGTESNEKSNALPTTTPSSPKPAVSRPVMSRTTSSEKHSANGSSPQRRGSWFSNISSKFSQPDGTPAAKPQPQQQQAQSNGTVASAAVAAAAAAAAATAAPKDPDSPPVPKVIPAKNAVLQHAVRPEGDGPYTPAPPKSSGQGGAASFLQVFRRLSSNGGGPLGGGSGGIKSNHGLVERKVLNVDKHRERCPIAELSQSKLRRVAFCVDVEIAPMPRYEGGGATAASAAAAADKSQKLKTSERAEGAALKNNRPAEDDEAVNEKDKSKETSPKSSVESVGKKTADAEQPKRTSTDEANGTAEAAADADKDSTKKKEKKKKSEEERKARKEKKRKLAEANGTIPMEICYDTSDSDPSSPVSADTPRTYAFATTNPVRIYRRCCQLRETPILKKITEQLQNAVNVNESGLVDRLDLTGYWLQLADLVTLGDYLAVVPVKELILENCGLTDEGLRVVLCGLLSSKYLTPTRRKHHTQPEGLVPQGGVCERLVLKSNKLGAEGWKYISLFVYMCRTLKCLDLSGIPFPKPVDRPATPTPQNGAHRPLDLAFLLSKAIGERLAGDCLELINLGETHMNADQLGVVMNGIIEAGVRRLGLAHNNIDAEGITYVARYIKSRKCEGLDLGGNDLRDSLELIGKDIGDDHPLWALSIADCNLKPTSLCKLIPKLSKLQNFRFIDLSHNHDLFGMEPSALSLLRRYIPKMTSLKRIHLADVSMSPEQAIAIVEVLPEAEGLAHINLLENPQLAALADARTEETQEEACALYASLLAAARLSRSLVSIEVDVPTEQSGEIVRALAKQVVAYCLRNLERAGLDGAGAGPNVPDEHDHPTYPEVLLHLVGHDVTVPNDVDDDDGDGPDEDYVIGGTGVVKALACCLKNSTGDESRRQSGEFIRDIETGVVTPPLDRPKIHPGKARDLSKHLLLSARKIRARLQPALVKAKANPQQDRQNYMKLMFLDNTLDGIIKRFEDEFPETRVSVPEATPPPSEPAATPPAAESAIEVPLTAQTSRESDEQALLSDADDYADAMAVVKPTSGSGSLSRTNSLSRILAEQEGKTLRTGYGFRSGFLKQEHYDVLQNLQQQQEEGEDGVDAADSKNYANMLTEMMEELNDDELRRQAREHGILKAFQLNRDLVIRRIRESDPDHWARFIESQEKTLANLQQDQNGKAPEGRPSLDEVAVSE